MFGNNEKGQPLFLWMFMLAACIAHISGQSGRGGTGRHSRVLQASPANDPSRSLSNLGALSNNMTDTQRAATNTGGSVGGRPREAGVAPPRPPPSVNSPQNNPFSAPISCNGLSQFRTIDGTCNNIQTPVWGASKTPQIRLVRGNWYEDGVNDARISHYSSPGPLPSARTVSRSIHVIISNVSISHTHLLMNFGQFLDHDITLTPEGVGSEDTTKDDCCSGNPRPMFLSDTSECFPIEVGVADPFVRTCIPLIRSSPVPGLPGDPLIRHQLNDLTAYVDGSQVYGSTYAIASSLRSFVNGELKAQGSGQETLLPLAETNAADCASPLSDNDCEFLAGDIRSTEQAGLASVHTLLLKEHNRISNRLHILGKGSMTDEILYQTTRKIVGAMLQRITYREFLPPVLGESTMNRYGLHVLDNGRFGGYNPSINPAVTIEFSTAAFRFGHSLIREVFSDGGSGMFPLSSMFDAFHTASTFGTNGMLKGLASDTIEVCDRFVSSGLRNGLFNDELDLPAFNIQRGRDHGLPSYNQVRRHFGLAIHPSFESMMSSQTHTGSAVTAMNVVYPSTEDVELFPGGLSEVPLPGAIVGETFANIIAEQFMRLKYGDRFWHETADPDIAFTDEQLEEIRKASLARLYCDNVVDPVVRKLMLLTASSDNPQVDCSEIPSIDLSVWFPSSNQPPRPSPPNNRRYNKPSRRRQPKRRRPQRRQRQQRRQQQRRKKNRIGRRNQG